MSTEVKVYYCDSVYMFEQKQTEIDSAYVSKSTYDQSQAQIAALKAESVSRIEEMIFQADLAMTRGEEIKALEFQLKEARGVLQASVTLGNCELCESTERARAYLLKYPSEG